MKTGARRSAARRGAAHLQMQLQLSAGQGRYYYLFRQDESLINDRLIGFLDGGVITSKRDLAHVDEKGWEAVWVLHSVPKVLVFPSVCAAFRSEADFCLTAKFSGYERFFREDLDIFTAEVFREKRWIYEFRYIFYRILNFFTFYSDDSIIHWFNGRGKI